MSKKTHVLWFTVFRQIKSISPFDHIMFTQMPEYWLQAALMFHDVCSENEKDVNDNCPHSSNKDKVLKTSPHRRTRRRGPR